nr:hypothetical protein [Tanacetum cinerariifolium]
MFYWPSAQFETHAFTQNRCDTQVLQAVHHFAYLQRADTLDFTSIAPFAWDTVYVFEGNTSGIEVAQDLGRINWTNGLQGEAQVSEDVTRFIFVQGQRAVAYVDINEKMIDRIQFRKYYIDERGFYNPYYSDSTGRFHNYTVNHFTRAQAKFILVRTGQDNDMASGHLTYLLLAAGRASAPELCPSRLPPEYGPAETGRRR